MISPEHSFNKDAAKKQPDYPTALDVVVWKHKPYQVAGTARVGSQKDDIFILRELKPNSESFRVKGARFSRTQTQDPPEGDVYRRSECVRITGKIIGGKKQTF